MTDPLLKGLEAYVDVRIQATPAYVTRGQAVCCILAGKTQPAEIDALLRVGLYDEYGEKLIVCVPFTWPALTVVPIPEDLPNGDYMLWLFRDGDYRLDCTQVVVTDSRGVELMSRIHQDFQYLSAAKDAKDKGLFWLNWIYCKRGAEGMATAGEFQLAADIWYDMANEAYKKGQYVLSVRAATEAHRWYGLSKDDLGNGESALKFIELVTDKHGLANLVT